MQWKDLNHYDLVIDTKIGREETIRLIVDYVKQTDFQKMEKAVTLS